MMHFEKAIGKPERLLISWLFDLEKWRQKAECLYSITDDKGVTS